MQRDSWLSVSGETAASADHSALSIYMEWACFSSFWGTNVSGGSQASWFHHWSFWLIFGSPRFESHPEDWLSSRRCSVVFLNPPTARENVGMGSRLGQKSAPFWFLSDWSVSILLTLDTGSVLTPPPPFRIIIANGETFLLCHDYILEQFYES
jgi:hypothetical protein